MINNNSLRKNSQDPRIKDTSTPSYKVETGIQLLARICRKPSIENFYPELLQTGPKQGEVIELLSNEKLTSLLTDIICTALLPMCLKGVESGVIIFNCNGQLNVNTVISCMRKKIISQMSSLQVINNSSVHRNKQVDNLLQKAMSNLYIMEIYDTTQFYATIYNLENILMEHSNISLVIFDSITSFYWSELNFKILKMDNYLKKLLNKIQQVTKEHKVTILYSRPEFFTSNKDVPENLEPCCEHPTSEKLNYRIHITHNNGIYKASIRTFQNLKVQLFNIEENQIRWIW